MAITTMYPAPTWLRELAEAKAHYEELFGWPVSVQVGSRRLGVATGGVFDAVSMPAALGDRVRRELAITMLGGPVIADPDGERWTFLTVPVTAIRPYVATHLSAMRVRMTPHGDYVVIPTAVTAGPGEKTWRWIEQPVPGRPLPPIFAVIAIARRLTEGGGGHDLAA